MYQILEFNILFLNIEPLDNILTNDQRHKSLHFLKSWVGLTFSLQFTWDSLCPCIYYFFKIIGEFHTCIYVFWSSSSPHPLHPIPPCPCFSLPLYLFRATGVCMGVGLSTGARRATWGLHPFPLPAAISSQKLLSWVGFHLLLPDLCWGFWLAWSRCCQVLWVHVCSTVMFSKYCFATDIHFLWLCNPSLTSSKKTPEPWKRGCAHWLVGSLCTVKKCFSGRVGKCIGLWAQR